MHPEHTFNLDQAFVSIDGQPIGEVQNVEVEVAPDVPEIQKSYWQEHGFEDDIARVCTDLEGEREQFLFNSRVRHVLELVGNARTIEDFDRYSVEEVNQFIQRLRNEVPQVEREVVSFINQLTAARAVRNENVDFI